MADSGSPGPRRDLWGLPAEELPAGAAAFLDMVREAEEDVTSAPVADEAPAPVVPLPGSSLAPDLGPSAASWSGKPPEPGPGAEEPSWIPQLGRALRLVGGEELEGPDTVRDEAAARRFLEMADLAGTVTPLRPDGEDAEPMDSGWLWADEEEETAPADALLRVIEQAMWHVSQSEEIRSEELRAKLLDLFTDFAVRRPWNQEERPEANRVNRLAERSRDEGRRDRSC